MSTAVKSEPGAEARSEESVPEARIARVRRWSWVWLVPLAVIGAMVALGVQASKERPVRIAVRFAEGSGLRPGDPVTCRGVQIGEVREVRLANDAASVVASVDLSPDAAGVAVEGTLFWVVRPEVSLRRVSGLDALFGPRSIAVEPGPAGGERESVFDGLASAPPLPVAADGSLVVVVRAARRNSLGPGSPVTYRDVEVGRVVGYQLADDAASVELALTIEPAYAPLVRENSRFFNVSGISADWGIFKGLDVRTDSLESVVLGGIGFATPEKPGDPVVSGHAFELADAPEDSWLEWQPRIPLPSGG
ncbi:MAG TPA: MlaD family protein [Phycisphaerales bacterium]|nr:MlaD family protein [Phycisphaerales bacterium]